MALLPPVLGGLDRVISLVDETIALADATLRVMKSANDNVFLCDVAA